MKEHGDPPRVEGPGGGQASALAPPPRAHCPASIRPPATSRAWPATACLDLWVVPLLVSDGRASMTRGVASRVDHLQSGEPVEKTFVAFLLFPFPASPGTDSSIAPDPIPSSAASIRRGSGASAINSNRASVGRQLSIHSLVAPVRQLVSLACASALRCPQPAAQHRPDEARSPADEATTFAIPIARVPSFDEISPAPTSRGRPQLSLHRAAPKPRAARERRPGTAAVHAQDLPTPGIPDDGTDGLAMQKGLGWNPPTTTRSTVRAKAAA